MNQINFAFIFNCIDLCFVNKQQIPESGTQKCTRKCFFTKASSALTEETHKQKTSDSTVRAFQGNKALEEEAVGMLEGKRKELCNKPEEKYRLTGSCRIYIIHACTLLIGYLLWFVWDASLPVSLSGLKGGCFPWQPSGEVSAHLYNRLAVSSAGLTDEMEENRRMERVDECDRNRRVELMVSGHG